MNEPIKELSGLYSLTPKDFEEYYKRAWITLTFGKKTSENKRLIIVGGQSGAGKSRLTPIAKEELANNAVIVDFDELRCLHPNYKEVSEKYPEITHSILHPDTERVKAMILKELIKKEYNVIYEGTLRNTQGFIDFAKDFKENNYNIQFDILAVPKLESYGSTFVRYAIDLFTNSIGRWVEKYAHDDSYVGVLRTIEAFKEQQLVNNINVYTRTETSPTQIYSSEEHQYPNAIEAIKYGREIGRKKAVEDFETKYETVKLILTDKKPDLLPKLADWLELYENEVEQLKATNEGR